MTRIDYRLLLVKYMQHVGEIEGVTFIPDGPCDPSTHYRHLCRFTAEEIDMLRELDKETNK